LIVMLNRVKNIFAKRMSKVVASAKDAQRKNKKNDSNASGNKLTKLGNEWLNPDAIMRELSLSPDKGVARHNDWVLGFDRHMFILILPPPAPPIPLGPFPYPFVGQIKMPGNTVDSNHKPTACGDIKVYSMLSHKGKVPFIPLPIVLTVINGNRRPSITIRPSEETDVFVNNKRALVIGDKGTGSCGRWSSFAPRIVTGSDSVQVG